MISIFAGTKSEVVMMCGKNIRDTVPSTRYAGVCVSISICYITNIQLDQCTFIKW